MLDSYEAVKIAVWDFLSIEGAVNALNLANLFRDIMKIEKGEVLQTIEPDLFHQKQDLGQFSDFAKQFSEMKQVKTAREVLEYRKQLENKKKPKLLASKFDQQLKGLLSVPPPRKEK